jgi:hypothetical protein
MERMTKPGNPSDFINNITGKLEVIQIFHIGIMLGDEQMQVALL